MSKSTETADADACLDGETVTVEAAFTAIAEAEVDREKWEGMDDNDRREFGKDLSADATVYPEVVSVDAEDENGDTIYQRMW